MSTVLPGRAGEFEPLAEAEAERWRRFGQWERVHFFQLVGMQVEEVRRDYCRMLLPYRPELEQGAGLVHGGAIASLLDTVVVPAIGSAYGPDAEFATVDLHVQYLAPLLAEDARAEGWVVKRGRSVVFCEAEARGAASAKLVARALLTYSVRNV